MPEPAHTPDATRGAGSRPTRTPQARAVVLTVDPLLAMHLAALHAGIATAMLTRLSAAGENGLRDTDALLLLPAHRRPDGSTDAPTTVYVGTDLDDAQVWARAVKLRAREVVVLPDGHDRLRHLLAERLDTAA